MTRDRDPQATRPTDDDAEATRRAGSPEHRSFGAPPKAIGPYRILEQVGEGGMGIVYLAEQQKPVRRRVAIKVIKPGMDSREVIARFESERQALALMNHPNIAKVFDAGTTDQGHPFFVMEYVEGSPLGKYCERKKLSTEQRLKLFQQICRGVQHAHQKSIIHRDLKPSNILVRTQDGEPQAKIIDFGLAKATGHTLTDKTLHTAIGRFLGTPSYMSPEQAEDLGADVDTRTDIYSLGVILYELLVGELPFDFSVAMKKAAFEEIRRKICEDEPAPPSRRASTLSDGARRLLDHQGGNVTGLQKRLRGDLDWITMMAMSKERARRYATASELSLDIDRYLRDDPVTASPPSATYRFGKFARKHRTTVGIITGLLLLLTVGSTAITILWVRAEADRRLAETRRQEAVSSEKKATDARREAEGARFEAESARSVVEESLRITTKQRDEILRLADSQLIREYRRSAEKLWPAHPEQVGPLTKWLQAARDLVARTSAHSETLKRLTADLESNPDDLNLRWQVEVLREVVEGLRALADPDPTHGLIASVEDRLRFASSIRERSIDGVAARWREATESIQDGEECPDYEGLTLEPQIGLLPLGRDPNSQLWEFAHLQTGEAPERGADGKLVITESTGIVFVLIPGGEFRMGAALPAPRRPVGTPNVDSFAETDEMPMRSVLLDPFFLSKFEMTQGQWFYFTGSNPSYHHEGNYTSAYNREGKGHSLLHPVENVSWDECEAVLTRMALTFPTEAQWEYAARANTTSVWSSGDEEKSLEGYANLADIYCRENGGPSDYLYSEILNDGYSVHAPVGSFLPQDFGLHDIHGNVLELCRDWYSRNARLPLNPGDGERQVKDTRARVCRGGAYSNPPSAARSADRNNYSPAGRSFDLGVRPARKIDF